MFTNMFVTRAPRGRGRRVSYAGLLHVPTEENIRPIRKINSSSAIAIPQENGERGMEAGNCQITINGSGSPDSQSSDDNDMDDIVMFPLFDLDESKESSGSSDDQQNEDAEDNMEEEELAPRKPLMTLRQRRHSRLLGLEMPNLNLQVANRSIIKTSPRPIRKEIIIPNQNTPRGRWLRAFHKIRSMVDPWEKFNINDLPVESAIRYRYNAIKKKWCEDKCSVRMEKEPFNHGAMRSCYRLKKLSSFSKNVNWRNAMNYVAKRYMEEVDRDVYFEDVRLQMDAKLWGEEFNRHNPPKKVDIFQMSIIEFVDRPGRPLYHLEHFIEGDYIKYNSNSGFVDQNLRNTPHAFSHFSFERSGHQMIIVDIQGVGDLWTDPQIHTVDGNGYGDGNLGTRGMALFFHSHTCNYICEGLALSKFDLAPSEMAYQDTFRKKSKISPVTVLRGDEAMCLSASFQERQDLYAMLAHSRSRSTSERSARSTSSSESAILESPMPYPDDELQFDEEEPMSPGSPLPGWGHCHNGMASIRRRQRYDSESEDSNASTMTREQERQAFHSAANMNHRPSCISHEINLRNLEMLQNIAEERAANDSILGQIHHDMAIYHELGRFAVDNEDKDMKAALYHEEQAAKCGCVQAILTLARLYLGMQRDVLVCFSVEDCEENIEEGVDYMEMAAHAGDRSAMLYMANAYETGIGLGDRKTRSYDRAVDWYEKAIDKVSGEEGEDFDCSMDHPMYQLKAKQAELYLSGGYDLDKDPSYAGELYSEAAEEAMQAMKGKLSAKYYMLAEEAWAQVEE